MSYQRKNYMRTALLGSTATVMAGAAMGVGGTAVAQGQGEEVETLIVTGSRIARADLTSVSPLSVVGAEEFRLAGAVNVEQLLNTLPQTIPGFDSTSNNPGNGTAFINLRGLGSNRNLVLVNGRRFVPSSVGETVDLNNIPQALVERVEVVTGGASAVYGSDAISGVVNFILRDDFEGVQIDYQYTVSDEGDGDIHSISAAFGGNFADGRGNVTVFANYWLRKPVFQGDRKFSTFALSDGLIVPGSTDPEFFNGTPDSNGVPGFFAAGSAGIPSGGLLTIEGGTGTGVSVLCPTTNFLCRFDQDGNVVDFNSPQDRFNYAPDNFLQLNGERWTFTSTANYEVNQYLNLYAELNFANNRVDNELAPTPVFTTVSLDVDSPFFSADTQAKFASLDNGVLTGTADDGFLVAFITRRNVEVGRRQSLNDRNAFRVVIGLDGTLDNGWRYDAYYSFGRVANLEQQENNIFVARLQDALRTIPDGAGGIQCSGSDPGCIPVNIFGEGNITPEQAASIAIPVSNFQQRTEQVGSVSLTGDMFDLGAGPAGFAVGMEYRREFADFRPDFALQSGQAFGFNQAQPLSGKFEVWELYTELVVPVLADMPGVEMLELSGAARFSDYTTAGTVYTYAAGMNWDIVEGFRVRAGYQRAVRAPNIGELFAGIGQNFPGANDPCAAGNFDDAGGGAALTQACINNGVPAANVGAFVQTNSQIPATTGGNPDLGEETADTYTVGIVAQPNFIPGLNITFDYYNIEITDAITQFGGSVQNVLNVCLLDQGGDPSSQFCQAITRRGSGDVTIVNLQQANSAVIGTEGFDLQIDYNLDLAEVGLGDNAGNLGIFFLGTHVTENVFISDEVSSPVECAGAFGSNCGQPDPKWRGNTRVTWTKGPLSISGRWRYIGSTTDDRIVNADPVGSVDPAGLARAKIDAKHYFDLSFTYQLNENFTIFGGADNLFSNLPAILGTTQEQGNTFPRTFPTLGTRFFIGGTARF